MHSYCCKAPIVTAPDSSFIDKQVIADWYYCSHCYRPCDRMIPLDSGMDTIHERI